jgi:hypothetical protein
MILSLTVLSVANLRSRPDGVDFRAARRILLCYHCSVGGPIEAFFNALAKYSWRTLVGVFVAAGAFLFFAKPLGVETWALPWRGYLVGAFILTATILATHLATAVYERLQRQHDRRIDLRMVAGSCTYSTWSINVQPGGKKPMLLLVCEMNFAHYEDYSVILRDAYLKGTRSVLPTADLTVEGSCDDPTMLSIGVSPIKARPGKPLAGRLVFVDQFNDPHLSGKLTFRPNTLPTQFHANRLVTVPNCVFCSQPVTLESQAKEAQMTAHTACIWP